jgi:hypothetical protein
VLFPLSAGWTGILIPIGPAEQVGPAIAIHVECGDALGVIRAQAMNEKSALRNTERTVAGNSLSISLRKGEARKDCNRQNQDTLNQSTQNQDTGKSVFHLNSAVLHPRGIPFFGIQSKLRDGLFGRGSIELTVTSQFGESCGDNRLRIDLEMAAQMLAIITASKAICA